MQELLTLGQMLSVHARLLGDKIGARDLERAMTFAAWNERSCRLANALLGLGLAKGDRVAVLAYNCVEWLEIYAATAKAGLIVVPINFRLVGAGGRATSSRTPRPRPSSCRTSCSSVVEEVRADLPVPPSNLIHFGRRRLPGRLPRLRGADRGRQRTASRTSRSAPPIRGR